MREFKLPPVVAELVEAREKLKAHYTAMLQQQDSDAELRFTFDGNLVGDIGEALAAEFFGVRLVKAKSHEAIDGYTLDGRSIQVKATGTGRGPAFRDVQKKADFLLFFDLNLAGGTGMVVFNGPQHYATAKLPASFKNQRSLTANQIRQADSEVKASERLRMIID